MAAGWPRDTDITEKIGTWLWKSRVRIGLALGFFPKQPSPPPPPPPPRTAEDDAPPIRWRKGELIGCGAFSHVYMGMNLGSGELLAVKQVLIGASSASKEKAQAHIRELEEGIKLLKKLSHANIVRYLGTASEEDTLNILLEFVPGGSISSLLGKFGSFPEAVIRMYTKQLLQGLEYLHRNKIIHRDIKGANIFVDNKGCIKLANFGASNQVAKLTTISAAKYVKGTPYWMAPEVIAQSGHSFSMDIWSVGCTVIEMATGKPPWSQENQEVAVLFHIGTTKSLPPIPDHFSSEAKDFLLKCLQQEPNLRPTASELLQHPFVSGECQDSHPVYRSSNVVEPSTSTVQTFKAQTRSNLSPMNRASTAKGGFGNVDYGSGTCSDMFSEKLVRTRPIWETSSSDEMYRFDDNKDDFPVVGSSFILMFESGIQKLSHSKVASGISAVSQVDTVNSMSPSRSSQRFSCAEVRSSWILKEILSPLHNEWRELIQETQPEPCNSPRASEKHRKWKEELDRELDLERQAATAGKASSPKDMRGLSRIRDHRKWKAELDREMDMKRQAATAGKASSPKDERGLIQNRDHRKWKAELDRELDMKRQAGKASSPKDERGLSRNRDHRKWKAELERELELVRAGKASSPKDRRGLSQKRDRWRIASPGK